jgi:hypothetical protein
MTTTDHPTPECPVYAKVQQQGVNSSLWSITCDEGWRQSIVCCDMYEWAADWLLGVLDRRPYAPGTRP